MIAALAVDPRPEARPAEAVHLGSDGVVGSAGQNLVEAGSVRPGLDQQRGFAPAARHAAAGLLVAPVVDLIAPFANPCGFGAVVAEIFDVPAAGIAFAIAGRVTLVAGIFLVDGAGEATRAGEDFRIR